MVDSNQLVMFQLRIEGHLERIEKVLASLKLGEYRLTLIARVPGQPDSDIVLTQDDDLNAIVATVERTLGYDASPDERYAEAMRMMNLYLIQYDSQNYYVQAQSLGRAVTLWKEHAQRIWGEDYDGTEEPESIALVHDEAVIR